MQGKINAFIDGLIPYDYILFGVSFSLFILFIILGILLRERILLAIFFILLAFGAIVAGPTIGYEKMHQYLFKNTVTLKSQKKLTFTKAVVVYGNLTNESKFDFSMCKIKVSAYKRSKNPVKDYLFKFNPFKNMSILQYDIKKGQDKEFKAILEPFYYSKDYNISLEAKCR